MILQNVHKLAVGGTRHSVILQVQFLREWMRRMTWRLTGKDWRKVLVVGRLHTAMIDCIQENVITMAWNCRNAGRILENRVLFMED